jgi:2-octaprenyl-6-methoxyphenol hydroxylase
MPGAERVLEVVVVGAGPAGLAAALALVRAGCRVRVLDARPLPPPGALPPAEGRTTALLLPAEALLERLGVWAALEPSAEPLRALRLVSLAEPPDPAAAPATAAATAEAAAIEADVTFDASEIGLERLGSNVRVERLRLVLLEALRAAGAELLGEAAVEALERTRAGWRLRHARGTAPADLLVAADGRRSAVRRGLRIAAGERPTGRVAIGTSFAHARPHRGVSIELHRPGGAFTLVPLPGDASSLVWVEPEARARRLAALDEAAFRAELERRVRPWLGAVGALGPRQAYPLVGMLAQRLVAPRALLLGEAAHALSPVGAQGLNTSLRDVAVLDELVRAALERGLDPAAPATLLAYERARLPDIRARFALTEGLAAAVASELQPVRLARAAGLRLIGALPALKRRVMHGLMRPMALPLPLPFP